MGPKMLITTRGSHGVMLFNDDGIFAAPAFPLEDESDPTGAGDSFAGGFFGYLAAAGKTDEHTLRQAIVYGSVMGSFSVEDFGTKRMERLTNSEIQERYRAFKRLTHFEDI
jgi:sugar/nucleoside kinase (ribokinase family)